MQLYDKLLQNKNNFEKNTHLKKGTKKSLKNDALRFLDFIEYI